MSTQSNVMPESSLRSQGIAAVAIPAAKLMYWSVRRELWENRAIYVAPVAVACVFLFGFSISIFSPGDRDARRAVARRDAAARVVRAAIRVR